MSDLLLLAGLAGFALLVGAFLPVAFRLGWPAHWIGFAILGLTMVAVGDGGAGADGSLYRQLTWGSLFAYGGFVACKGPMGSFELPLKALPGTLWLLLLYAVLSIVWSPLPGVSARRVVQLFGIALVAVALFKVWQGKSLFRGFFVPIVVCLGSAVLFAAIAPGQAFDLDGAMRAFTSHKNTWGQFSVVALICCLYVALGTERRLLGIAAVLLALVSVVLSRSGTSLVAALGCILLVVPMRLWHHAPRATAVFGFAIFSLACGFVLLYTVWHGVLPLQAAVDAALGGLGKSATLTGRTFLWELMGREIAQHPWLGVGFGGFWAGFEGPSARVIAQLNWGPPTQAHSGYIDVVNETGFTGLALLSTALLVHLRKIWQIGRHGASLIAQLHLALLFTVLVVNVSETSLMRTTHLLWIIMTVSLVEVHMTYRQLLAKAGSPGVLRSWS
jgi:exopolysaccharide production protein ExoQ